jgi:hypothetical protein
MTSPTVFTWDQSTWGNSDMMWSDPGIHALVGTASAETGSGSAMPVVRIEVEGTANAVSDSTVNTSELVAPANTGVYVTATSARWYDRLPAVYRNMDAQQTAGLSTGFDGGTGFDDGDTFDGDPSVGQNNFPMLRWFASMIDQAGDIEALLNRFSDPTACALTDPMQADAEWLPWLAQFLGKQVTFPTANETATRNMLAGAFTSAQPGTKPGIKQTVQAVLSGTQSVTVTDHFDGDPWQIEVATLASETPPSVEGQYGFKWGTSTWGQTTRWGDPDAIVWLLDTSDAAPVGYTIVHTTS